MKFAINHNLNGKSETWTRKNKEAFLQLMSIMFDDFVSDGARSFNLVLTTDLDTKDSEGK
jgi:hypothetical protein